jgi:HNH endonuclease
MADAVSQQLRREVRSRAGGRCEYCLMDEQLLVWGCEVDHILSRKHGGVTELPNLAYACARCNRAKGTDIGSVHPESEGLVRLFNPRKDEWGKHFRIDGARIIGLTLIGQVTVSLLQLNHDERLLERELLQRAGKYPK